MSQDNAPEAPAPTPPPRRKRKFVAAAGAALVVGASGASLGPAAPWIVDNLADGQRVWRLGRIQIEGVSGGWIGDLRARHVEIADGDGVWLEAENLSLAWRPLDLLGGTMRIDAGHADAITIHRQPTLSDKRPVRGDGVDVVLGVVDVNDLHIAEAAFGEDGDFTLALGLSVRDQTLTALDLELRRTDSNADRAIVRYDGGADFVLALDIEGQPGGLLAGLFGAPERALRITGQGDGGTDAGEAQFVGTIGGEQLARSALRWTQTGWTLDGGADLDLLPATRTIARRIGASLAFTASGVRRGDFSARAQTPFLAIDLSGTLDDEGALDGPARFTARTARLSDIACEAPFEFGAATLTGEFRRANGTTAIRGELDARELNILGRRARFTGPVTAALTEERFELSANLRAPDDAPALFTAATLTTEFNVDRSDGRFALERARLEGDAIALDARGWVNDGDGEFSGAWRVKRLEALAQDLRGGASGNWRAFARQAGRARVWTTAVEGAGAGITGNPEIVPQLLGASPTLDARITYENNGLTVEHARVNGAQLRAAATGRIVRGEASLALEASARGPLSVGDAQITGAVDATGRLTGRLARPTLNATAQLAAFTASGVTVDQPNVVFTLAPAGNAYRGHATMIGAISGQPVTAEADVSVRGATLDLANLVAQAAQLEARGRATLSPRGVDAQLVLTGALDGLTPGVTGRIEGDATLTPQTVTITARLVDVRAGELFVRAAAFTAAGPYRAIEASFDMRGRLRRAPLRFAGQALISAGDTTRVSISGQGQLAGADIATRTPIDATWTRAGLDVGLDITIADGALTAQWRERGRALSGSATIEAAPVAPLAAIWGETATGRIDGAFSLANAGSALSGEADITFDDARFAGRQRGTLDLHIVADLDPDRLQAVVDAQSSEGLVARFEANAPVQTSAAPLRIALQPERRGQARWSVHGPADSLWAAARLQDQQLSGQLDGEGEIAFGAGTLTGDGRIAIVNGRFEDKLTGITLINLDAEVSIGDRGANIERFSAAGPRGGTMTATGGSANPSEGRIAVRLNDMRVADRPDARARGSGELTLAWEGLSSTLTGTLDIAEADLNIATNPEAGIPTLDVIEINREDEEDETAMPVASVQRSRATQLDVRVRAPGRVFTRGRGVDAEWALDLRLAGTSAMPLLYGEATAVRGQLALSGQPFDIESGRIAFNGDPLDARIDLVAQRDTADLTARIVLSGTAADPDITLTSDPGLPEDEILPQVLFGRSVADLSPLEAAQIAAALASLSGRASLDLVDAARAAAGLDRFNVRQDESGGFLVAGGVYLTRDVYVELARTGLGQAATRVEWTIRPRLVLITSFLANGDQRASIRWRRETD